ncbi:hypothetical protein EDD29_5682 [Actinocorallia herbida]|uniref:Uncharacterized protein n=1 Tax=Actinocorallia herbida TaxID=58109 RepID=A0A3N1D3E5_9ACTN|nr:hypothetical protein [Actinocorallia herbida]ROO88029.1 hypothetical protein EDD29_5682 [Actinocorallia herbida]
MAGDAEHDPLADEADLLTIKEARARVVDEIRETERLLETSAGPRRESLNRRLEALKRADARFTRTDGGA